MFAAILIEIGIALGISIYRVFMWWRKKNEISSSQPDKRERTAEEDKNNSNASPK